MILFTETLNFLRFFGIIIGNIKANIYGIENPVAIAEKTMNISLIDP
jgi:hypothetical protein